MAFVISAISQSTGAVFFKAQGRGNTWRDTFSKPNATAFKTLAEAEALAKKFASRTTPALWTFQIVPVN